LNLNLLGLISLEYLKIQRRKSGTAGNGSLVLIYLRLRTLGCRGLVCCPPMLAGRELCRRLGVAFEVLLTPRLTALEIAAELDLL
jgi:hypothetical protein